MFDWADTRIFNISLTLLVVLLSLGFKFFAVNRIQSWNIRSVEFRRKWIIQARLFSFLLLVSGLILIWGSEIKTIAFSLVALAVAIAIATKELLMCLMGSFLKTSTQAFRIGDRIEVSGIRGDVVDHGMVTTSLLEIGADHRFSGRWVTLPNSIYLNHPVLNESLGQHHCLHGIDFHFDQVKENWLEAYRLLEKLVHKEAEPYLKSMGKLMQAYSQKRAIEAPSVEPSVDLDFSHPGHVRIHCRIPCRMGDREIIQKRISEGLAEFYIDHIRRTEHDRRLNPG
jgi:small-conductance mechanosensitive channel